jgi:hypothetical protein
MQSLHWLLDVARRAGVIRLVVNGSFVTDKLEPNDIDCVLLIGPDFPRNEAAEAELLVSLSSTWSWWTRKLFNTLRRSSLRQIGI